MNSRKILIFWIGIISLSPLATFGDIILDPCDMQMEGGLPPDIYCTCNPHDTSQPMNVQCYLNKEVRQNGSSQEWKTISTLTETVYLEFITRDRHLKTLPPPIIFQKLKKLQALYIKSNGIEIIPPFAFQNSSSLFEINFKDNRIQKLNPYAFSNMENITEIILDTNQILEIEREVFVNLPSLRFLRLAENSIEVIHDQAFRHLENLEDLELQKNNLTYLTPEVFKGLQKLRRLELMKNTIQFLGNNVFMNMPNLEELDLMENNIISVTATAFHGLKKLGRLNLRQNKIVELQPGTFTHLQRIYYLDVRENELETFSMDLISDIYSNLLNESMQLNMKDNRFKCDCRILWMQKLWNETKSQIVQYYLNYTTCDVPHKFAIALEETDLHFRVNGGRMSENVTLVSGPMEDIVSSNSHGSSTIRVTEFKGEGCGHMTSSGGGIRKNHRHGQKRIQVKNIADGRESWGHMKGEQDSDMVVVNQPKKSSSSYAEPVNDNPNDVPGTVEASSASSASTYSMRLLPISGITKHFRIYYMRLVIATILLFYFW